MDDYVLFFRDEVRKSIDPAVAMDVIAIVESRAPRRIFETLEKLRVQGYMTGDDFERKLTDFYWQFC